MGVSKLCCFLCHKILSDRDVKHRGSHELLYLKSFNIPNSFDDEDAKMILELVRKHVSDDWINAGDRFLNNQLLRRSREDAEWSNDDENDDNAHILISEYYHTVRQFKDLVNGAALH